MTLRFYLTRETFAISWFNAILTRSVFFSRPLHTVKPQRVFTLRRSTLASSPQMSYLDERMRREGMFWIKVPLRVACKFRDDIEMSYWLVKTSIKNSSSFINVCQTVTRELKYRMRWIKTLRVSSIAYLGERLKRPIMIKNKKSRRYVCSRCEMHLPARLHPCIQASAACAPFLWKAAKSRS